MDDNVRAFITGAAIGGVSLVMFEVNKFALKKLWGANCTAAKMAWEMIKGAVQEHEQTMNQNPKYTPPCPTTSS